MHGQRVRWALLLCASLGLVACYDFDDAYQRYCAAPGRCGPTPDADPDPGPFVFEQGLAFTRDDDIYLLNLLDGREQRLTTGGGNGAPSLAGRQVVFVHRDDGGVANEVRAASIDPPYAQRTLHVADGISHSHLSSPVLAPDGDTLVFAYAHDGIQGIAATGVTGLWFEALTAGAADDYRAPTLDSTGTQVVVLASEGRGGPFLHVARIELATSRIERILTVTGGVPGLVNRAALSPDGKAIVYDATFTGVAGPRIYLHPIGGAPRLLTSAKNQVSETFPTWVDEGHVAFASRASGPDTLVLSPVETASAAGRPLTTGGKPCYGFTDPR